MKIRFNDYKKSRFEKKRVVPNYKGGGGKMAIS